LGVWITRRAKPSLVNETGRFNHQRVVSFPMTNRVSEPRGIRVLGKRSPVGPDRTPFVFALEELQHPARSLNELNWGGHKHDPGETNRIALQNGVIPARYGSASVPGPLLVEPRLRPRRH